MQNGGKRPGAGRPPGSPNKTAGGEAFKQVMKQRDIDPIERLFDFMEDKVPCNRCDEQGRVDPVFAYYASRTRSFKQLDAAKQRSIEGERDICPLCASSKFKILDEAEQSKATIRLVDSRLPKLSSIVVKDDNGLVTFIRMNALERQEREQAQRLIDAQIAADKKKADE